MNDSHGGGGALPRPSQEVVALSSRFFRVQPAPNSKGRRGRMQVWRWRRRRSSGGTGRVPFLGTAQYPDRCAFEQARRDSRERASSPR
jgi:hypothetical protein